MLSSLSKFYIGTAVAAFLAFVVYAGAVRYDRTGAFLLGSLFVAALVAAYFSSAATTTDTARHVAGTAAEDAPVGAAGAAATEASWWPLAGAAAAVAGVLGVAFGGLAWVVAGLLALAAMFGWAGQSYAEHPTYSAKVGGRAADRLTRPVLLPVLALVGGALIIISISRIFLGVGTTGAVILAGVLAVLFFAGCALLAAGRRVPGAALGVIAVALALAIIGGGALSTAVIPAQHEAAPVNYSNVTIVTQGTAYKETRMEIGEGEVRLTFENHDPKATFHNIGFYELKDPKSQVPGRPFGALPSVDGGQVGHFRFNTADFNLEKGKSYQFRCDFHPAMVGEVDIVEGPPAQVTTGGHQ